MLYKVTIQDSNNQEEVIIKNEVILDKYNTICYNYIMNKNREELKNKNKKINYFKWIYKLTGYFMEKIIKGKERYKESKK